MAGTIQAWYNGQSGPVFGNQRDNSDAAACMPDMLARRRRDSFHKCFHPIVDTEAQTREKHIKLACAECTLVYKLPLLSLHQIHDYRVRSIMGSVYLSSIDTG